MNEKRCTIPNTNTVSCHAYNNGECMNAFACDYSDTLAGSSDRLQKSLHALFKSIYELLTDNKLYKWLDKLYIKYIIKRGYHE